MRAFRLRKAMMLVPIIALLGLAVFFLAPVIPINHSGFHPYCGPSSGTCTIPFCTWTEWESPSFLLFNVGYHYDGGCNNLQ